MLFLSYFNIIKPKMSPKNVNELGFCKRQV